MESYKVDVCARQEPLTEGALPSVSTLKLSKNGAFDYGDNAAVFSAPLGSAVIGDGAAFPKTFGANTRCLNAVHVNQVLSYTICSLVRQTFVECGCPLAVTMAFYYYLAIGVLAHKFTCFGDFGVVLREYIGGARFEI